MKSALGPRQRIDPLELPPAPTREFHRVTPVGNPFGAGREAEIQVDLGQAGMTLSVIIQYSKTGETITTLWLK